MNQKKKGVFRRIIPFFKSLGIKMLVIFIMAIISAVSFIVTPIYIGRGIDLIADGIKNAYETGTTFQINFQTMGSVFGILIGLIVISMISGYYDEYLMASVSEIVALNMRNALSEKLHKLPLRYYDSTEKGEILSRVTNDIEKVSESLRQGLSQLISAIIRVSCSVAMLLIISPKLSLISFGTIAAAVCSTVLISKRSRGYFHNNQTTLGKLNGNIEEAFTGQLVIKAFNHEKNALGDFREINNQYYEDSRKAEIVQYIVAPTVRVVNSLGYIIIAIMSAFSIIQGRMSLGTVQMFIQYTDKASEPIIQCTNIFNTFQAGIASAQRIFQILDELEEVPDAANSKQISIPEGNVVFDHVRFGYSDDNILMKDININVNTGDRVAIVGQTGAGKTTLVNLLMRFYDIQGGKITIDGISTNEMSRADLRSIFGMVLQDTWLFGGSIRDNIAYSNLDASDEEVISAAKSARANHFIRTLPEGYDTILNEDGLNVSQGQKQLLTIARAILADPTILILDEATSSVDSRTEKEIQKAMDNLMEGRTSFIIAHKLSTIKDADMILVMENGTIIEQGNHDELIEKRGAYERLYQSQFA